MAIKADNHTGQRSNSEIRSGFSLIEVLVAFSVLFVVIISIAEIRLRSIRRLEQTANMNQIQNDIRKDIASVRKQALRWKCDFGACSGLVADKNMPSRYSDSHCSDPNPLSTFPISNGNITSDKPNIEIKRTVVLGKDNIMVTYVGTFGEQSVETNITIIPKAMSWCK